MSTIAILGGGISGLSTAYYMTKLPSHVFKKIVLLESSNRLGGWIRTTQFEDGTVFEHGPRNMRATGKTAGNSLKLIEDLGLDNDIIALSSSNPASKNRFIYANSQICVLPNSIMGVVKRLPPFSKPLAMLGWKEPFQMGTNLQDETVYDFFQRKFGKELAEYISDPLCRGIFAGDCRKLSVKSCFPPVFNLEQKYGSLIRGAILMPKDRSTPTGLQKKAKDEKWAMWTLRKGLTQLPQAIMNQLHKDERVEVLTGVNCDALHFKENSVHIEYGGREEKFDHVMSSVPAKKLGPMISLEHGTMSAVLDSIPVVSVAVVNLEYENWDFPVKGFGHLVPSCEPSKVLGILYESCVFPEHDKKQGKTARVTCMMGGAWFEEYFGDVGTCDHDLLGQVAIEAVRDQLKIKTQPTKLIINVQKECIPQYHIGHCDKLAMMDKYIIDNGLAMTLLGASYQGASINDCINNARLAVDTFIENSQ